VRDALNNKASNGDGLAELERRLRSAADQLWANSPLRPSEYSSSILGVILNPLKGYGPSLDLRITKKEGIPVQLVPEEIPCATVVAVKRLDELGLFSLGRDEIAALVGLNGPQTTANIRYLKLTDDREWFKAIKKALRKVSIADVWESHVIRGMKGSAIA
jgi:hypothetical protein